jgi:hypothetical protein
MRALDRAIAVGVLAGIALLAAACGGGGGSGSGVAATSPAASRQPYLAYSRCMRAHGVPFWPNPSARTERGGVYEYPITAHMLAQEHGSSWNAALSACAKQAPPQLPFTEAQLTAARSRLLKVTQCMRSHGFPGWPDPDISPSQISFLPPRAANPDNPKFQAAEQVCHLPAAP